MAAESQEKFEFEPEPDDSGYVDKIRKCGTCRREFLSNAGELKARGVLYIPLHCPECAEIHGADVRRRTELWRERMRRGELRWKKNPLAGERPWEKTPPPGSEDATERPKKSRKQAVRSRKPSGALPGPPREPDAALVAAANALLDGLKPGPK